MTGVAPLTPMSLGALLHRIDHEWSTRNRIFDLPTARIWSPEPDVDLGFEFLGRPCATPIGPAAGPHSQMAQNLVLTWLGGSRLFELKTVQTIDELQLSRPCIDMQDEGYNVEWSQELRIAESLDQYVQGAMLIHMLRAAPEAFGRPFGDVDWLGPAGATIDRKSTRLNSSHVRTSRMPSSA